VGTESQPAGKAVLRKNVVTEDVHTTVPVEHDEVYVERLRRRPPAHRVA
jgi:stress response protein YsnF